MRRNIFLLIVIFGLSGCSKSSFGEGRASNRPDDAATGQAVARVIAILGNARVSAMNGVEFAAKTELELLRNDRISVGPSGFVALELLNGFVVRIDEDVEMETSEIVLLDAPKTTESLKSQVERLLTSDEQRYAERVIGWHARLSAGQSAPATTPEVLEKAPMRSKSMSPIKEGPRPTPPAKKPPARVVVKTPATQKAPPQEQDSSWLAEEAPGGTGGKGKSGPERMKIKTLRDGFGLNKDGDSQQGVSSVAVAPSDTSKKAEKLREKKPDDEQDSAEPPPAAFEWRTKVAGKLETHSTKAPALLESLRSNSKWLDCLRKSLLVLPVTLNKLDVMLKVNAGKVVRVVLSGALPTPKCLNFGVLGQQVPDWKKSGWLIFEISIR